MIRKAAVAGAFYPANRKELKKMVDGFLAAGATKKIAELKGVIAPHAGYSYSGTIAGAAYRQLASLPPRNYRVFLVGPSHFAYITASVGKFEAYETPLGKIKVDRKVCAEILQNEGFEFAIEAHTEEHALELQLPFLQRTLRDFQIVPILAGSISPTKLATTLAKYFGEEGNLFVISSDFSHYLPEKEARAKDSRSLQIIVSLATEEAAEVDACGRVPILAAMQLAQKSGAEIELLDYSTSAAASGDTSAVVGYAALAIS